LPQVSRRLSLQIVQSFSCQVHPRISDRECMYLFHGANQNTLYIFLCILNSKLTVHLPLHLPFVYLTLSIQCFYFDASDISNYKRIWWQLLRRFFFDRHDNQINSIYSNLLYLLCIMHVVFAMEYSVWLI
jgi:hypothetical protein